MVTLKAGTRGHFVAHAAAWRLESQRRFSAEDKCKAELNNEYDWPRLFKGISCSEKFASMQGCVCICVVEGSVLGTA